MNDMMIGKKELVGKTITDVRPLTEEELDNFFGGMAGFGHLAVGIELDGKMLLVPAADAEINGVGALLAFTEKEMKYVYEQNK